LSFAGKGPVRVALSGDALDLTDTETAELAIMARRVATAVRDTFEPNGIHVQQHNGGGGLADHHSRPLPRHPDPGLRRLAAPDPDHWIEVTPSDVRQEQADRLRVALASV
jgi:diadenosine tetraphosphate (Ap4A) HIT family hydrolase